MHDQQAEFEPLHPQFARAIAREMRIPLTSIKGLASTLLQLDVDWTEGEKRGFLETIKHEADRLNYLISGLVYAANIGNNKLNIHQVECQVADILRSVKNTLAILTRHHRLNISLPHDLPMVLADQVGVAHVVLVLVENTCKYCEEDSPIVISAETLGLSHVIVSVAGRAVHIPLSYASRLLDSSADAESAMTGCNLRDFGLAFCRHVITAHGGKVWFESYSSDGPRFRFALPVTGNVKE
ncbi:MAG: hypothetical protein HYX87_07345 [Chloroflexi bacterium]|nr:hypothetical protein [Chloroflexota bacterium]